MVISSAQGLELKGVFVRTHKQNDMPGALGPCHDKLGATTSMQIKADAAAARPGGGVEVEKEREGEEEVEVAEVEEELILFVGSPRVSDIAELQVDAERIQEICNCFPNCCT